MYENGKRIMMERPKHSDALGSQKSNGRTAEAQVDREALVGSRARTLARRMAERIGAIKRADTGRAERRQSVDDRPGQSENLVVVHPGGSREPYEAAPPGERQTPAAAPAPSAATTLVRSVTSAFRPGLVTVLSLIAAVYVIAALSSSPTAIGIDAVAPRDAVPVAAAPSSSSSRLSVAVQPTVSADPPAVPVAPEVQRNAAVGPVSDPLPSATASAPSSSLPPSETMQPAISADPPTTPPTPEVRFAAVDAPSPIPRTPAVTSSPSLLPTAAEPRQELPPSSELVAPPVVARRVVAAPATAGVVPVDAPPVVPLPGPADLAVPAVPTAAAPLLVSVARAPEAAKATPRLADPVADASGPGGVAPSAPAAPTVAISLPGPALPQMADSAAFNILTPAALAPARLDPVQERALVQTAPDSASNVAVTPPAPPAAAEGTSPNRDTSFDDVFVRIAVPATVPEAEAEDLAGLLREVGIGDGRLSRVNYTVSETHIRYYFEADADAAASLGELLGADVRDHSSFRPSPPNGTLEIFVAGSAGSPPPRAAAPQRSQPRPVDDLTRMRERIVDRLRR